MPRTCEAALVILALLVLASYAPPVHAASLPDLYSVNVANGAVSVSINLNTFQNVTSFESSFTLPRLRVSAVGVNSTDLAQTVQNALRLKNPQAQVNNLNLQFGSSAWLNATSRQWLNESLSFDVNGVTLPRGAVAQVDLSWKSFAVSSRYSLAGVEVNRIGEVYLSKIATDLAANSGSSQFVATAYQVNGKASSPSQFLGDVENIFLFNFSSFATPVSQWRQSYAALASSLSWSMNGPQGLGMAYIQQLSEPGSSSRAVYGLFYDLTGMIISPAGARADGDALTFVTSSLPEMIMGLTIVSVVVIGSVTYVWERKVLNRGVRRKPRR